MKIGTTGNTTEVAKAAASEHDPKVEKVARDFEAILVRQLLGQAKVAGKGGYADMAVESLASSVSNAGGLGLSRTLASALDAHRSHVSVTAAQVDLREKVPHANLHAAEKGVGPQGRPVQDVRKGEP
jgi:Rod binding domain-containing protein